MKMLILTFLMTFPFGAFMTVQAQDKQEEVKIQIGEQKTATQDKINIKFLSLVEDSRCPEGVNCVWAGNAKIEVEINCGDHKEKFEMNTNLGPKGASFDGYAINLVSLSPYPKEGVTVDAKSYLATFNISRLTR